MMRKIYILFVLLVCYIGFGVISCTEKLELKTQDFEDILVVEATITDELKRQEIKISRTYLLENDISIFENNANVRIEDSNQNVYNFNETRDGFYMSTTAFQAEEGVTYKLYISTIDGKEYVSSEEILAAKAAIDRLYAEAITINGEFGIQVLVDTNEDLGNAQFFRYEYEETYKIVAPYFAYFDIAVANLTFDPTFKYSLDRFSRPEEQKICYSSNYSNTIILTNVNTLSENSVKQFPIRFIPADDPILRDRYSILVKQYVQSAEANNFYKILKALGSDESIFVDSQPGFIQGNVFSQQSSNEKVIGFFDVSSVTSKRVYFNYSDFDIAMPPYFYECDLVVLDYDITDEPVNERLLLYQLLTYDNYKYVEGFGHVFTIVKPECGDCTSFSSSVKPDFWEE